MHYYLKAALSSSTVLPKIPGECPFSTLQAFVHACFKQWQFTRMWNKQPQFLSERLLWWEQVGRA